jgi:hypothetical protein
LFIVELLALAAPAAAAPVVEVAPRGETAMAPDWSTIRTDP